MGSVPDTGGASSSHCKGTSTPIPDLDALPDVEIVLSRATHANQRGNDLFAARKIEEALLQYQLALQIASQVPSTDFCSLVHVSRAVCFCNLGTSSTPNPDWDALPDIEIVLSRASHANQQGSDLFAACKIEEALLKYQLALQIAFQVPSTDFCSLVHVSRAVCFCNLGWYVDAVKESTKALELNPSYIRALQSRAEAHQRRNDIDAASADVKKILVLDPSNEYAGKQIRRLGLLLSWKEKSATWFLDQPKLNNYRKVMLGIVQMMEASTVRNVEDPNTGSDCPVSTMQQ